MSDTAKFSPEPNSDLKLEPMTAFFENRGIKPGTYDFELCMEAVTTARAAQAEQIAALSLQVERLREALPDPLKLNLLAAWVDGRFPYSPSPEVQADLRTWASRINEIYSTPAPSPSGVMDLVMQAKFQNLRHSKAQHGNFCSCRVCVSYRALAPEYRATAEGGGN